MEEPFSQGKFFLNETHINQKSKKGFSRKQNSKSKHCISNFTVSSNNTLSFQQLSIRCVQQQTFTLDINQQAYPQESFNLISSAIQSHIYLQKNIPYVSLQNIGNEYHSQYYSQILTGRSDSLNQSSIISNSQKTTKILQNIQNNFLLSKRHGESSKARKFFLSNRSGHLKKGDLQNIGIKMDAKQLQQIRKVNKNLYNVFLEIYRAYQKSIQQKQSLQQNLDKNKQQKIKLKNRKNQMIEDSLKYQELIKETRLQITYLDQQKFKHVLSQI